VADSLTDSSIQNRKLEWIAEALGAIIDQAEEDHKRHKTQHKGRKADRKGNAKF
jgi:hypothetical protein